MKSTNFNLINQTPMAILKTSVVLCALIIQTSCTQKSLEECKEIMHQCDVYGSIAGDPMAKFEPKIPLSEKNILKAEKVCGEAVEFCPSNGRMFLQNAEAISRSLSIQKNKMENQGNNKHVKSDLIKKIEKKQLKIIESIHLATKNKYPMGYFYRAAVSKAKNNYKNYILNMKKAADLGVPKAQAKMAGHYFRGNLVESNFKLASKYAKLSHKNNDIDGSNILAYFYLHGIGVVKNISKAKELLEELLEHKGSTVKGAIQNIKLSLSMILFEKGRATELDLFKSIGIKKQENNSNDGPYILINKTKAYDLIKSFKLRDQSYCKIKKELREKIFPQLIKTDCNRFLKWMR